MGESTVVAGAVRRRECITLRDRLALPTPGRSARSQAQADIEMNSVSRRRLPRDVASIDEHDETLPPL